MAAARDAGAEVVILDDVYDVWWLKVGFRDVGIVVFDVLFEEGLGDEDEGWIKVYRRRADDACAMCYTSGTSGLLKVVMLLYGSVCVVMWVKLEVVGYDVGDMYLYVVFLYYVGGLSSAYATFVAGANYVFVNKFDLDFVLCIIVDEGVMVFIVVFVMMCEFVDLCGGDIVFLTVRKIFVGVGRLIDELYNLIWYVFLNVKVMMVYGMMEMILLVMFFLLEDVWFELDVDLMFVGNAVLGVEVKTDVEG